MHAGNRRDIAAEETKRRRGFNGVSNLAKEQQKLTSVLVVWLSVVISGDREAKLHLNRSLLPKN